jgi:hypothetical protein
MLILDAVCRAGTAKEVCYLLTSYVEMMQFYSTARHLPACVTALPVRGLDDIAARLAGLQAARVTRPIDCAIAEEAANLLREAASRLKALHLSDAANFSFDRRSAVRPDQALTMWCKAAAAQSA